MKQSFPEVQVALPVKLSENLFQGTTTINGFRVIDADQQHGNDVFARTRETERTGALCITHTVRIEMDVDRIGIDLRTAHQGSQRFVLPTGVQHSVFPVIPFAFAQRFRIGPALQGLACQGAGW
ncbi:MAG: hypothetical protein HQL97_01475 [Magnetococcales bacterium]|nr:hypothetical protein [Magnetococcales bacterium]